LTRIGALCFETRCAAADEFPSGEDAVRWEQLFDETVRSGEFLYAVTFFITSVVR